MHNKLTIATIGDRGHAESVIGIINKSGMAGVDTIYKPNCTTNSIHTSCISDILNSDAVFILSPNYTHFAYLDYLYKNYSGYVFCEKPPVATLSELGKLKNNPEKTYFNFNLRFSGLKNTIETIHNGSIDEKILKINIMDCHGLAYKDIYKNSWRSNKIKHPLGVIETLAIHYLDLCNFIFGSIECIDSKSFNTSMVGTANDTAELTIQYKDNIVVSIFSSYATPMMNKVEIITTNSIYIITENEVITYHPRDTFDKQGRFITPKKLIKHMPRAIGWEQSLSDSIIYFLNTVKRQLEIPIRHYNASIETSRALLEF